MKTFWRVTLTLIALVILSGFICTQALDYIIPTAWEIWELKDPTPGISGMMWMAVAAVGMFSIGTMLVKNIVKPVSYAEWAEYLTDNLSITLILTMVSGAVMGVIELTRYPTLLSNRGEILNDSMMLFGYFSFWFNKCSLVGLVVGMLRAILYLSRSQPQPESKSAEVQEEIKEWLEGK